MFDSDSKKRMISLRLSDVEYDILKTHYRRYGARNVSDLARLALLRMMIGPTGPPDDVTGKLASLDGQVCALESRVSLLERKKVMP